MVNYDSLTKAEIIALIIYYETPSKERDKLPTELLGVVNNILRG